MIKAVFRIVCLAVDLRKLLTEDAPTHSSCGRSFSQLHHSHIKQQLIFILWNNSYNKVPPVPSRKRRTSAYEFLSQMEKALQMLSYETLSIWHLPWYFPTHTTHRHCALLRTWFGYRSTNQWCTVNIPLNLIKQHEYSWMVYRFWCFSPNYI